MVSDTKIRAGIVGAGLMGPWHARAIKSAGGQLMGIADIDVGRTTKLVSRFPAARAFGGVEEMLSGTGLDVLHVCTPAASHRQIAELAIDAGISLIVEKPLFQNAAETIQLYELAAKQNVSLLPVHQFPFQAGVTKAKTSISKIGRLVHMQASICSAGGDGLDERESDQIAADILPHPLSLFQTVMDELLPTDNWIVSRPGFGELRIEGCSHGISMSILVSMNARPTTNSFQIFGTKGTIHLDLFHGFSTRLNGNVSKTRKILHPFELAAKNFSAASLNLVRRSVHREAAYPGLSPLVHSFYKHLKGHAAQAITAEQAINVAVVRDVLIDRAGIDV